MNSISEVILQLNSNINENVYKDLICTIEILATVLTKLQSDEMHFFLVFGFITFLLYLAVKEMQNT